MTTMSDLDEIMVAEILCRTPMTCLKTVRSVCKKWNALSKKWFFFGKAKQFLGFMMMDSRVCSLRFDLRKDLVVEPPSIKQVSILDQIEVSKIFHSDGLLLCIIKNDTTRLLVWNPYLEQTRWIQPRHNFHILDCYAIGHDKNRKHKILRFVDDFLPVENVVFGGNTYFFAKERYIFEGKGPEEIDVTETEDFLLCFDFTAERFGPRLPLPFHSYYAETVTLSCVKEDQLSVLCQRQPSEPSEILEIWVSTNIQPNAVSWSIFLKVDMRPLTGFQFNDMAGSFFIDQENKVAVVFDLDPSQICRYQTAYIIGQEYGGYFNSVNIGEVPNLWIPGSVGYADTTSCIPPVCSSYVPSLVQIG
ncbi:hypothetical protein AXX17_AT1G11130 [Arabidopsis thaliana]|uniref:F-box associated beta-propeller type 1 domain-containing protein n=1 Tax=Arabidopsis thaliana TaxID=3702 RepID=A0A178WDM3_ARATH|nr:hypothetical protein AXX17_AT1G11130 [Arabidopsis thaliana]